MEEKEPQNVTVICACGRIFKTASDTKEEHGFKCKCGLPIIAPITNSYKKV